MGAGVIAIPDRYEWGNDIGFVSEIIFVNAIKKDIALLQISDQHCQCLCIPDYREARI